VGRWRNAKKGFISATVLANQELETPYVQDEFAEDLSKDNKLQESKRELGLWLTKENMQKADQALLHFISTFKKSIDKLYTAWGD
jgi:hypothetical protein